jgi:hypothetical protein
MFLLPGSYRTYLPIKEMNRQAKRYWGRIDKIKKFDERERKKVFLRCCIITDKKILEATC